MRKNFSTWYTTERWQKPTPEEAAAYEEAFGHKPHRLICKSENGLLFSKGHYPTKLAAGDLPASFIHARIGKLWGYYNAAAIVGADYKPNLWINHLFRDDWLAVSFSQEKVDCDDWESMDIILSGWDIVTGLAALSVFSNIPKGRIVELRESVANKVRNYRATHLDELDCIEESYFWERLHGTERDMQQAL